MTSRRTVNVDAEIEALKRAFLRDEIGVEELEDMTENWLKWEHMSMMERLEFERYIDEIRWKVE